MVFKEKRSNQDLYKGALHATQEYLYYVGKADRRIIQAVVKVRWCRPCGG